jgi:hypothetical protein
MSAQVIDRLQNLIRVVSNTPDEKFNITRWYDPSTGCGCAIGHAIRDDYFIANKFNPLVTGLDDIARFFEITLGRASSLFYPNYQPQSKQDVLARLRVLLLEKMAQEINNYTLPKDGLENVVEPYLRICAEAEVDSSINVKAELESV